VRSALRKLFLALDGYLSIYPNPVKSPQEILRKAVNFNGQKILKKWRKDALISSFDLQSLDEHEIIKVSSIDEIFNYRFAVHYVNEEIDDYKLGTIPVDIDPVYLNLFREQVENFLPDEFNFTDEDIQFELSVSLPCNSSMCIDNYFNFKSIPTHKNKFKEVQEEPELSGKRVVIPIHAQNDRDAIMFTANTSTHIRVCDRLINKLWESNKWFAMVSNKETFLRKIRKFREKHSYFINFDFEKEGITKPRELIITVLEEIDKKFPRVFWKDMIKLYSNYSVNVDGETIEMNRGHGLGMANSLTSCVITVFLSVVASLMQEDNNRTMKGMDFDVLSFNDDTVVSIKEELLIDFEEYFYYTAERLSMRYKREKTFWGREFVFCEEYSNVEFNNKLAYYTSALYTSCMCINITQAKQFVSSFTLIESIEGCFDFIEAEFGYEFYEDEYLEPIAFGGWFSRSLYGVDLTFYEKEKFSVENLAACRAFLCSIKRKSSKDHPFLIFNDDPILFSLPMVERLHGKKYENFWRRLYDKRQKEYNRALNDDEDIIELYEKYRKTRLKDVLAPKIITTKIKEESLIINRFDLFKSENPIKDYLLKDKAMDFLIGGYGEYKRLTNHEIQERRYYLTSTSNITLFFPSCFTPETNSLLERSYWRPERVVMAMRSLYPTYINSIPFLIDERIEEVKEKYGIKITDHLLKFLNSRDWTMSCKAIVKLSEFIREDTSPDDLYNAVLLSQLDHSTKHDGGEDEIEQDWKPQIATITNLDIRNFGNQDSDDHKIFRKYVADIFNTFIDGGTWNIIINENNMLVPVLNKAWLKECYINITAIGEIYNFEDLEKTGWFKFTTISMGEDQLLVPLNIISLPIVKFVDFETGGKNQGEVQTPIIIPQNIVTILDVESSNSDELNANDAFDLLEGFTDD